MVDLAEYALYRCIKKDPEEHVEHKLKKITYSFEILDDCRACDGAIGIFFRQKLNMFSSKSANSSTVDRQSLERATLFVNHSYTQVLEGDGGENGYEDDNKWLQPKYDKDNDVLQLMVSKYSILYTGRVWPWGEVWQSWQIIPKAKFYSYIATFQVSVSIH